MSTFVDINCEAACMSRKGRTAGGAWGHPQSDMHVVAVVVGSRNALVGAGLSGSYLGCINKFRKHYFHLVGASFLVVKVVWALKEC